MCRSESDTNRYLAATPRGLSCTAWRTPRRSLLSRIVAAVVGVLS